MENKPTVLYCNCSFKELITKDRRREARHAVERSAADVVAVADLCQLAARRDPLLAQLAATPNLTICACYPRAIRWLFHAAGTPLPADVAFVNLRSDTDIDLSTLLPCADEATSEPAPIPDETVERHGTWVPWFPVIDYDICTNCKQCLSFCPFGVYAQADDGTVVVTQPENCKNNCPACARVCPTCAIMFPKVVDSPINGADVNPADVEKARERIKEQKVELAQKGIHSVLAQRKLRALARRMADQHMPEAEEGSA